MRATIPWGDFGTGLRNARKAVELEGPASPWRALVCAAFGNCLRFSGELEEAGTWYAEAIGPSLAHGQWRVATTTFAHHSLLAGDQGRVDEQTLLAQQAVELAREHGLEEVEGEVFVALGASLASRRRFEEALPVLEQGVELLRVPGHPAALADALIRHAAVLRKMNRYEAAAPVIEEAREVLASCADPRAVADRLAALERRSRNRRRTIDGALSDRELVILRMLNGPLSERDIGRELYLSHNTIHSHTQSIYRKLGASSRVEALEQARELGLI